MVTIPDSVSNNANFLVKGPPRVDLFSEIMAEIRTSVRPKNSLGEK